MADFRVLLFNQDGTPEGELSKDAGTLLSCTRSEEINAEHSLSLTTQRHLEVGTRALTRHQDGRWREWVVDEPSETHDTGEHAVGSYHLCWSLQYDLQTTFGEIRELGMASPATARQAMSAALDGSQMWSVGTCDVTTKASSVVMNNDTSAWDRITTVVKYWGGEVDAEITVNDAGVTSRKVSLLNHLGSTDAKRRFEWGHDLTGITRTPEAGPYACWLIPLGNGETEEAADGTTTYEVKLDISEAATFVDSSKGIRHDRYSTVIRDTQAELAFRKADGKGGWEYPKCVVTYSTDDLDELVALAKEDILSHTRPSISYSGTVANFAKYGMDTDGIQLGDEIQALDRGFNPGSELRVQERVISMQIDEMGVDDAQLNIGKLVPKLERTLATVAQTVGVQAIAYKAPVLDLSNYTFPTPYITPQTIDKIVSDGIDASVGSIDYSVPDYGSAISGLQSQVAGIASELASGDGIIHTLNGVEIKAGSVVAFTTAGDIEGGQGSDTIYAKDTWGIFAPKSKTKSKAAKSSALWGSGK